MFPHFTPQQISLESIAWRPQEDRRFPLMLPYQYHLPPSPLCLTRTLLSLFLFLGIEK